MRTYLQCFVVFAVVAAAGHVSAQPTMECGTVLTPEQAAEVLELERRGFYQVPDDLVIDRFAPRVPVTLHVARRSDGTGGISAATATAHFNEATTYWESMGIELFQFGSVRFINDSGLLDIDNEVELTLLWSTDVVPNSVNVYFVREIALILGGDACGIGTFTSFGPVQGVVVDTDCTTDTENSTLAHEIGHYFDLYHTHETAMGAECPSGSNCTTAGDLICDTPADPDLSQEDQMNNICQYIGTSARCGSPFNPDTRNVMSYANPKTCRDHFSNGQRLRALATLANLRPNLIEAGQPSVIWTKFNAGSLFPNGDFTNPYNTFASGIAATPVRQRMVIIGSTSAETGVFTRPVILDSFRGSAIIGN